MSQYSIFYNNDPTKWDGPGYYLWIRTTGKYYGLFDTHEDAEAEAPDE